MSICEISLSSIQDGDYGSNTKNIKALIARAKNLPWHFGRSHEGEGVQEDDEHLVMQHLGRLEAFAGATSLMLLKPMLIAGDWSMLRHTYQIVRGDDLESLDDWRSRLADLTRQLQEKLREPDLVGVVHAPLFPVSQNPMVFGGMLVDAENALRSTASSDRNVVWSLACDVDLDFWGAMLWEFTHGDKDPNPFLPLIACYEKNIFPIGVSGDQFVAFAHRHRVPVTTRTR